MGEFETQGSGMSKKIAKTIAAKTMFDVIPDEWKTTDYESRKRAKKRKSSSAKAPTDAPTPAKQPNVAMPNVPEMKSEPKPIWSVIQTAHPVSALYEYCKKGKIKPKSKTFITVFRF